MTKLSSKAKRLVNNLDKKAQIWGWQRLQGYGDGVAQSEKECLAAQKFLIDYLLELEQKPLQDKNGTHSSPTIPWTSMAEDWPPPDVWLLVTWGDHASVDKAHTFVKWKHRTNPKGYLVQGHPGSHNDVTHWSLLPGPVSDKELKLP